MRFAFHPLIREMLKLETPWDDDEDDDAPSRRDEDDEEEVGEDDEDDEEPLRTRIARA